MQQQHQGQSPRDSAFPGWNDANVAELGRLWDAGDSASTIAGKIGATRNAVIGKIHRLGLSGRPNGYFRPEATAVVVITPPIRPKTPARTVAALSNLATKAVAALATRARPPAVKPPPPPPLARSMAPSTEVRSTLQDRTERMCPWPFGDPSDIDNYRCCGGPKDFRAAYCDHHAAVAKGKPWSGPRFIRRTERRLICA